MEEVGDPNASNSGRTAGYVLTGIGGAAILGAIGWELALMGDRNDFIDQRDLCEAGLARCDTAAFQAQADNVNDAKLPTGLLYGVGGTALLTDVILISTSASERDEAAVTLTPVLGPGSVGARLSASF
ncbi:MAG: hypothetical protein ACJAYU_000567 [Bradymonadia bacterium]|jgi:hypothetical protein